MSTVLDFLNYPKKTCISDLNQLSLSLEFLPSLQLPFIITLTIPENSDLQFLRSVYLFSVHPLPAGFTFFSTCHNFYSDEIIIFKQYSRRCYMFFTGWYTSLHRSKSIDIFTFLIFSLNHTFSLHV